MQLGALALGSPQVACLLLWLIPQGRDSIAFQICRWLWFALCIAGFCLIGWIFLLCRYILPSLAPNPLTKWIQGKGSEGTAFLVLLFALPAGGAALLVGRIDWAAGLFFGSATLNGIVHSCARKKWFSFPAVFAELTVLCSIPAHSAKLALVGFVASPLLKRLGRFDWGKVVLQKPTQAVYVHDLEKFYKEHPVVRHSVGILKCFYDLEMWEEANQEFQRLREGKPALREKDQILWEIRLAAAAGQTDKAIRLARQNHPEKSEDIALLLARLYAQEGKREAALETAAKIRLRGSDAWGGMGEIYAAMNDAENALRCYERASQSSNKYQLLRNMASTLMALKQYRDAAFVYRDALAAAPYLATEDLKNLALCCRQFGKERAALQAEALAARGG